MPWADRYLQMSFSGGEMSPEVFSRYDDARLRSGAALLRNFITHPRGSAQRRPGFALVNECKDSDFEVRLLPFRFSTEQVAAIEMGRATVEGLTISAGSFEVGRRYEIVLVGTTDFTLIGAESNTPGEIFVATGVGTGNGTALETDERGYFRFHIDGGTLLQTKPPEYRGRELAVDINLAGNSEWQLTQSQPGPSHGFQTADPIVFTMHTDPSSVTCTFDLVTEEVTAAVTVPARDYKDDDVVVFSSDSGDLPAPLEPERYYYIRDASGNVFRLSDVRGGPLINFTSAGGAGPFRHAVLPRAQRIPSNEVLVLKPNHTFYAIRVDDLEIQIAETRADALAGTFLDFDGVGTVDQGDIAIHYDYRRGATVYDGTRVGNIDAPAYLFRETAWGTPGSRYLFLADHQGRTGGGGDGHDPTEVAYWQKQSGVAQVVTFNVLLNRVDWGSPHGLADNSPITFETTGLLPDNVEAGVVYYVRNTTPGGQPATAETFFLAATPTGALVIMGGAALGTHTAFANGYYEVPHFYPEDDLFEVNLAQSADVMSLAHQDRPLAELRRRGATDWVLADVQWNAQVSPPQNVIASSFEGQAVRPDAANATNDTLDFNENPALAPGEIVTFENIENTTGGVYVADGTYSVGEVTGGGVYLVTFREFEAGTKVNVANAGGAMSSTARVRVTNPFVDAEEIYAVTALDANNEESEASQEVRITNNLAVRGAYNTISWDPVNLATRYRVYKDVNGLFGLVGETDAPNTTFVDDDIGPDLSFTPPILDGGLLEEFADPTFDPAESLVVITGHGLPSGAPVIFQTNDTLPAGIEFNRTYYTLDAKEDSFQLTETPTGTEPVSFTGTGSGQTLMLAGLFPGAVCYFEQRRVVGGARTRPQDFWLTASSTETDLSYSIPTLDADRIQGRIAARERNQIRHALPAGHLIFLTSAAEYRVTSLDGGPLTPSSISPRAPTQVGVSTVAPIVANNVVLFPEDRGGHIREMGYVERAGDYITADVALRAAHLFDGFTIAQMAYHEAPQPVVWAVSSTGELLGMTYIPEEQIAGWHRQAIAGVIESVVSVPEGLEDRVYIVANRNGTRYIERMGEQTVGAIEDAFYVDFGATYKGAPASEVFVPHLTGLSVIYLADGLESSGTVGASGYLQLATPASTVQVGLPYQSDLQTIPLGMAADAGAGVGRTKDINHVFVRVRDSGRYQAGPTAASLSTSARPVAGELLTALEQLVIAGNWNLEGQLFLRSETALPLIVAGVTLDLATGG